MTVHLGSVQWNNEPFTRYVEPTIVPLLNWPSA